MTALSERQTKRRENKSNIIEATVELIKEIGIENITIRKICEKADIAIGTFYYYFNTKEDLLGYFVLDESYNIKELKTDERDISGRIIELYMMLIEHYMSFGKDFIKSFYSTENTALSAYMSEEDGKFISGTIMDRSETEFKKAVELGVIKKDTDCHMLGKDICTIIKGSVFEWSLCDGKMDIEKVITRIIKNYLSVYIVE
ncbi:MAG: TetR/AcrR family transcriptional regulator [Firmicutes bacterium]|nr:TetR/AcrR family transcriptional regulator [Bacillota bacterium]